MVCSETVATFNCRYIAIIVQKDFRQRLLDGLGLSIKKGQATTFKPTAGANTVGGKKNASTTRTVQN
jgi:hypothetical protein